MNIIEKLKELQAQATPGPWEFDDDFINGKRDTVAQFFFKDESNIPNRVVNGALIVTAINALPDIIELAEAVKLYKEMAYENHANNYARMCVALAKLTEEVSA
jgi:hypothetical protein